MDQYIPRLLIYVVDDEILIAGSLAAILRRNGFCAFPFTEPQVALSRARLDPPQLLIVDLVMPGASGVDLAIAVSEVAPNCRILLFSGSLQAQTLLDQSRRQGYSFEFISKPIKPRDLLAKCGRLSMQYLDPFSSSVLPGIPFS